MPEVLRLRADLPTRAGTVRTPGGRGRGGAVMTAPRTPTREQRAAIDLRGRDVLLEAGAGTGKTGVLVDRYCDLVAVDGISPDAILAFTFTDKAAAQLRERVGEELR